jgi:hypothetical protein
VIHRHISKVMLKHKTYLFLRVKTLEISCSVVEFFSDRDEVLLVVDEIGLTEELGFCQCDSPIMRKLISRDEFKISDF